jgi:hypothetical protein
MAKQFTLHATTEIAGGAITKSRLLKHGSTEGELVHAVDGAAPIVRVSGPRVDAETGKPVEAHAYGILPVEYGDDVTLGAPLTADSVGRAVPAAEGAYYAGFAEELGGEGTIGSLLISPGYLGVAPT